MAMDPGRRLRYPYAQLLAFFKQYDAALGQYRLMIAEDPDNPLPWRCAGFLHAQRDEHAPARQALAEALRLAPHDAATRYNLAFVLHAQAQHEEAALQFEQVLAAQPKQDRAWYGLGLCWIELNNLPKAAEAFQQAAKLQPFNPEAGCQLALTLHALGRSGDMLKEYERVKGFDPRAAARIRQQTGIA